MRLITLAHQSETMARQQPLRELDHYLKPLRPRDGDGSDEVADYLDRRIARQEREAADAAEDGQDGSIPPDLPPANPAAPAAVEKDIS